MAAFSDIDTILLIGGGNMGAAMARGWLAGGLDAARLTVCDPKPGAALQPLLDAGVRHVEGAPSGRVDALVIAVKPQVMEAVLPGLAPVLDSSSVVISVAAGKPVAFMERLLGPHAIVRAMPNTPAMIGRGVTGAFANPRVGARQRAVADTLLAATGGVEWVPEERQIDWVTGLSGSGPAYVFLMAEALAQAGEKLGLDPQLAMRLARQTVAGAGELIIRSQDSPDTLRRNVTSPNGTTAAALEVLMADDGLAALMAKAVAAAADRATELSKD